MSDTRAYWTAWATIGVAIELTALVYDKPTLSMTIRSVVNSPWRKAGWGLFCLWLAIHIDS